MKGKSGMYTVYHFVDFNNLRVEISSKMRRQQKKGALKQTIETTLKICIGVSRKLHAKPAYFFIVSLVIKKE